MPYLAGYPAGPLGLGGVGGRSLGVRNFQQGMFIVGGTLADRLGYVAHRRRLPLRTAGFGLLVFAHSPARGVDRSAANGFRRCAVQSRCPPGG